MADYWPEFAQAGKADIPVRWQVDGVRLLSQGQLDNVVEVQTSGPDQVMFFEAKFGLGFMLSSLFSSYGGPNGFGHAGSGGSVGFADPDMGVGYGYVMNQMTANMVGDPRTVGLTEASYEAIGTHAPGMF